MPKQYTFKTTQVTEWLEPILDNWSPMERSRFIRDAIIASLGESDVPQGQTRATQVTHKVNTSKRATPVAQSSITLDLSNPDKPTPLTFSAIEEEPDLQALENALDNLGSDF